MKKLDFITGFGGNGFAIERENTRERERERELDPIDPKTRPGPATVIRRDLPIPATSPAMLGTDLKPTVVSPLSSSPETDQNAGNLSSKLAAKTCFRRR